VNLPRFLIYVPHFSKSNELYDFPYLTSKKSFAKLTPMKCDTCGKESAEVKRVVVDKGYDRASAKPLYNCPECYEKKERSKSSAA